MPGYAPALTTLAQVKTELGLSSIADDDYLTWLIKAMSDYITKRCNRTFHFSNAWVESVAAYGTTTLALSHTPVLAITSITIDGSAVGNVFSIADSNLGWLYSASGWRPSVSFVGTVAADDYYVGSEYAAYLVTYAGGYVTPQQAEDDNALVRTLPYDLEQACVHGVVSMYRGRGQDKRVSSESLMSYSVSYREAEEVPEISSAIRRYRHIGTGR